MYCDGIRPNMKYIAKLFWHIRHVWASVPFDHHCTTGCSEEYCKHYEFLRSHLLHILQHPELKTGVGVILRSDIPGAGKSKIFYWLWKSVFGYEYGQIMTKACALTSNFNAHSERAKLTVGDDIKSIKGGLGEEMLGLITQEEQRLEKKSVDAKYVADYQEVFLLTNQDDPPVPIRVWDRRWFIISVSCMFAHKREGGIVPEFNEEGAVIGKKYMTPTEYWKDFCNNYETPLHVRINATRGAAQSASHPGHHVVKGREERQCTTVHCLWGARSRTDAGWHHRCQSLKACHLPALQGLDQAVFKRNSGDQHVEDSIHCERLWQNNGQIVGIGRRR